MLEVLEGKFAVLLLILKVLIDPVGDTWLPLDSGYLGSAPTPLSARSMKLGWSRVVGMLGRGQVFYVVPQVLG